MVWLSMVCYEVLTKTYPYTEELKTFRSKLIKKKSFIIYLQFENFFDKIIQKLVKIGLHFMLWNGE